MDFQIKALPGAAFSHLFEMSDAALAAQNACRQIVSTKPGTPCRVSLVDAEVGERVILLNYVHQPSDSPYQASHAIFVREGAVQATPAINEVPEVIRSRVISVRMFDTEDMMIGADVVAGESLADVLSDTFDRADVAYVHLHNAKPGYFAASVVRAA